MGPTFRLSAAGIAMHAAHIGTRFALQQLQELARPTPERMKKPLGAAAPEGLITNGKYVSS